MCFFIWGGVSQNITINIHKQDTWAQWFILKNATMSGLPKPFRNDTVTLCNLVCESQQDMNWQHHEHSCSEHFLQLTRCHQCEFWLSHQWERISPAMYSYDSAPLNLQFWFSRIWTFRICNSVSTFFLIYFVQNFLHFYFVILRDRISRSKLVRAFVLSKILQLVVHLLVRMNNINCNGAIRIQKICS